MTSRRMRRLLVWTALAGVVPSMGLTPTARAAWRLEGVSPATRGGEAMAPVLAPDGRRVAYLVGIRTPANGSAEGPGGPAAPVSMRGRLWLLDRGANEAARLGKFPVDAAVGERLLAFAPTGSDYAAQEGTRSAPVLWFVAADGNRYRVGPGRSAAFGPKGDYLAYLVWDTGEAPAVELHLFDTARRESKRLARVATGAPIDVNAPAAQPRWLPDGARIVFPVGGDLYAYGRFTGRIEALTRPGDVRSFDVAANGTIWAYRQARDRDAAGIWSIRPDGKAGLRVFRADELPAGVSALSAGPDANTLLFLGETALGRGLIAADTREVRWRYLAAADAFSLRPGGFDVALEMPGAEGRRNIFLGRLAADGSRAGN